MTTTLQQRIDRLAKSAANVVNAKNPAQRSAAQTFLIQRAQELVAERDELEAWLHEADEFISTETPEINADPDAEYNRHWIGRLHDYEAICTALNDAWGAYMETMEAA